MNNSHKYETYLHFIEALEALKKLPQFPALDSIETELLNEISLYWKKGNSLLVNEAISIEKIGSRLFLRASTSFSLSSGKMKDCILAVLGSTPIQVYIFELLV